MAIPAPLKVNSPSIAQFHFCQEKLPNGLFGWTETCFSGIRARVNSGHVMSDKKRKQAVYTLLVEVGRKDGDGLPADSSGAALMCYASGVDEAEAVRETVAILKQADLAPLDVSGYGTLDERLAEGHDISDEERALMARALEENSVIVAQMTPFFEKG